MIFIDSNVPMYLVGAEHPHKTRSRQLIAGLIAAGERLVTSAEVFQEILHRYTAIDRRDAIRPAWDLLAEIVDSVFPIELEDVERARDLALERADLSARDALHTAVMRRHGVARIFSFDGRFDAVRGVSRLA